MSQEKGQGGLVADMTAAEEWYRKAADQNLACAQYNLGVLRSMSSEDEALSWFQLAAEQGDTNGSFSLGCLLARRGDQDGAMTWWRKGADLGDVRPAPRRAVHCLLSFFSLPTVASARLKVQENARCWSIKGCFGVLADDSRTHHTGSSASLVDYRLCRCARPRSNAAPISPVQTESAYYLGVCCERGFGKMEQNASEAALFHRTAAEAG